MPDVTYTVYVLDVRVIFCRAAGIGPVLALSEEYNKQHLVRSWRKVES